MLKSLSPKALQFRSEIAENPDPYFLLIWDIPASLGHALQESALDEIISSIEQVKLEIEGVIASYQKSALDCLKDCLNILKIGGSSVRIKVKAWADCFVGLLPSSHSGLPLLNRMRMEYKSDSKMIESIVSVVSHVSLSRWEDDHLEIYQRNLKLMIDAIERESLRTNLQNIGDKEISMHLEKLLSDQIGSSYGKLVELRGAASAKKTPESYPQFSK